VLHPGAAVKACDSRCGLHLLKFRCVQSLLFGLCGGACAWAVASARLHSDSRVCLIALTSSYVSWAAFWGWHVNGSKWPAVHAALKRILRVETVSILLLLKVRILAALLLGLGGYGFQQTWKAVQLLRKQGSREA